MTSLIMIELEINFPEDMIISPKQARRFTREMRKIAQAGALGALQMAMNDTTKFTSEPMEPERDDAQGLH